MTFQGIGEVYFLNYQNDEESLMERGRSARRSRRRSKERSRGGDRYKRGTKRGRDRSSERRESEDDEKKDDKRQKDSSISEYWAEGGGFTRELVSYTEVETLLAKDKEAAGEAEISGG